MRYFGVSQVGQYHLDAGSDICQDSFAIVPISDEVIVAAVADGVGSEEHSEYASRAAAKACCEYCADHYKEMDPESLLSNSFYAALFAVQDASETTGIPINQLHCTLCAVLFTKNCIYYGNVGDSGAIGLMDNGQYVLLTKPQNDEEGRVAPLTDENSWVFGKSESTFASILLATDGFYNYLFPPYLPEAQKTDFNYNKTYLDVETLSNYIDSNVIGPIATNEELGSLIMEKINQIPRVGSFEGIVDDLTVVALISDIVPTPTEYESFDREACKKEYQEKVKEILYPSQIEEPEIVPEDISGNLEKISIDSAVDSEACTETCMPPLTVSKNLLELKSIRSKTDFTTIYVVNDKSVFVELSDNYVTDLSDDDVSRLTELCSHRPTELLSHIEWPKLLVQSDDGKIVGYLTNRLDDNKALNSAYSNPVKLRMGIALTLAYTVDKFDEAGISLGILNESNVFFSRKNSIIGFRDLDYINRVSETTTRKCLAILIFKLLFNGYEPIVDGKYRFINDDANNPGVPDIGCFPEQIRVFFKTSFEEDTNGNLPSAADWFKAINEFRYRPCTEDNTHLIYEDAPYCPYCRCKEKSQTD